MKHLSNKQWAVCLVLLIIDIKIPNSGIWKYQWKRDIQIVKHWRTVLKLIIVVGMGGTHILSVCVFIVFLEFCKNCKQNDNFMSWIVGVWLKLPLILYLLFSLSFTSWYAVKTYRLTTQKLMIDLRANSLFYNNQSETDMHIKIIVLFHMFKTLTLNISVFTESSYYGTGRWWMGYIRELPGASHS